MNKKVNTLLFILGATLFNVLIVIISFLLLIILLNRFLPEDLRSWAFTFSFIPSIVISFLVYRAVLKFLMTKIKMEKYFDPIFAGKNQKK